MPRNERGEDWSKFMGEMNKLGPHLPSMSIDLSGGSAIPILNRNQARAAGFPGTQAMQEMERQRKQLEDHKITVLEKWFDEEMKKRLPVWLIKLAGKYPWVIALTGYRLGWYDQPHEHEGKAYPSTVTYVDWLWKKGPSARHVWQA